jgi:hypothetical protein
MYSDHQDLILALVFEVLREILWTVFWRKGKANHAAPRLDPRAGDQTNFPGTLAQANQLRQPIIS